MAPKQQESQQDDVDESATRRHWHEVNLRASYNDISSASCKPAVQPKLSTVMWPTQAPGEYVEKQYPNVLHGLHRLERGNGSTWRKTTAAGISHCRGCMGR
eukprot:7945968-Ditylum_brightwellii.AAC.1